MTFPEGVLALVREASQRHRANINAAIEEAEAAVRELPDFDDLVSALIRQAIQELVYRERCHANHRIKTMSGEYHTTPKVSVAGSEAVNRAAESAYSLSIAGTMLGLLRGDQLKGIAETEEAVSQGHAFNAALCRKLAAIVPPGKTVREAVKERRLRLLIQECQSATGRTPVEAA